MPSPIVRKIAQIIEVSPRTVERALNGELKDTRPTIVARNARIKQLAREMGYRPNAAARAVATGRFGCIALVVMPEQELLPARMLRRLCTGLHERLDSELKVTMLTDETFERAEVNVPKVLAELSVDGLLVSPGTALHERAVDLVEANDLPVVWINVQGVHDCVYPDEIEISQRVARDMLAAGCTRLAFAALEQSPSKHFSRQNRWDGFAGVAAEAGVACRVESVAIPFVEQLPQADDPRLRHWLDVLARPDRPDGVLCYGVSAAGAVLQAAATLGLELGRDLRVASFCTNRPHAIMGPMQVCEVPFAEMADAAVAMMAAKLERGGHAESCAVRYHDYGFWG
ncbi:MAG: substrate-binding domain-containing protein [Planctomycetota bacterium]|jgi:LacI family transcriptional regulator|nr:substrate-binding domain-containing protein [Planctomycetota bacterium]